MQKRSDPTDGSFTGTDNFGDVTESARESRARCPSSVTWRSFELSHGRRICVALDLTRCTRSSHRRASVHRADAADVWSISGRTGAARGADSVVEWHSVARVLFSLHTHTQKKRRKESLFTSLSLSLSSQSWLGSLDPSTADPGSRWHLVVCGTGSVSKLDKLAGATAFEYVLCLI